MRNRSMLLGLVVFTMACGGGAAATTSSTTAADSAKKDSAAKAPKRVAAAPRPSFDTAAAAGNRPLVRETYQFEGTTRDPFRPLVVSVERGPALADLRLVAILFDADDPGGSIATFRDIGNEHRYTVSPGQRIGRIAVVSVASNSVKLREDDFGTSRDQLYSLRKPQDEKP